MYTKLLAYFDTISRADAESTFSALYVATSAATFSTVGFFVENALYSVEICNNDLRAFLHWNTTSRKNGKDGEREPRLRIRIPKSILTNPEFCCNRLCSEIEFAQFTEKSGGNKGEAFECFLTSAEKSAAPYWEAPDSEIFGSVKVSEATVCTLSALASALEKVPDRAIFSAQYASYEIAKYVRTFLIFAGIRF